MEVKNRPRVRAFLNLLKRRINALKLKPLAVGYSGCGRCWTPWRFTEPHSTNYSPSSGMFPLCELCWSELTPQERLPYYLNLWVSWGKGRSRDQWTQIRTAVLAGK